MNDLLTQERYHSILQILSERDAVTVSELSEALETSESTIRRDLNYLDEMGKLKKVFGGATAIQSNSGVTELPFESRESEMYEEKIAIAQYAATMVHDGDFVFIDAGTTTYCLIDYLANKSATYITNGIAHSRKLIQRGFTTHILGGKIKPYTEAVVGTTAINQIARLNFTKAFIGTNGIDLTAGFSTPELDEGAVKEAIVRKAYMSFILSDHTKFRRVFPVSFAEIQKCCIITDSVPDERFLQATVIKEVNK